MLQATLVTTKPTGWRITGAQGTDGGDPDPGLSAACAVQGFVGYGFDLYSDVDHQVPLGCRPGGRLCWKDYGVYFVESPEVIPVAQPKEVSSPQHVM